MTALRSPRLLVWFSLLLLLAAAVPLAAQSTDPVVGSLETLTVVETTEYDIDTSVSSLNSVLLSADGERLLNVRRDSFCLYAISGEELDCTPLPDDLRYDPASLRWSPDGRYVAFADDRPFVTLRDADVWVLDTQTGTFTNLTNDGDQRSVLETIIRQNLVGPFAPVDFVPRFTDDGTLYFIRLEASGENIAAAIYRISPAGGRPELVVSLVQELREDGWPIEWDISPDGQTGIYVLSSSRRDRLYRIDFATGEQTMIHELDRQTEVAVLSMSFSPQGNAVLWHSQALAISGGVDSDRTYVYITTLTGETVPATTAAHAAYAAWSPDGSAIVYSVIDPEQPERTGLYLSAPGKEGERIFAPQAADQRLIPTQFPTGFFWGANNTLLVSELRGRMLLALRLGPE